MSYSFYWDCTLPIKNIKDIVNISIVPKTSSYDEGEYLSVRGYVAIDGEYVSKSGVQYLFNERIPLDITLPKEGRTGEIKTDISNFDYTVHSDDKLYLNLNLTLNGYDVRKDKQAANTKVTDLSTIGDEGEDVPVPLEVEIKAEENAFKQTGTSTTNEPKALTEVVKSQTQPVAPTPAPVVKPEAQAPKAAAVQTAPKVAPVQPTPQPVTKEVPLQTEPLHQNAFMVMDDIEYLDFDENVFDQNYGEIDLGLEEVCESNQTDNQTNRKDKQVAPKPAPVVVEAPKPAPVVVEAPKPAPVVVEAPKPAPVVVEAPKPAPVVVETPKPTPVVVEAPKPTPVVVEAPKPAPVVVEAPKAKPVEKSKIFDLLYDLEEEEIIEEPIEEVVVETPKPVEIVEEVKMPVEEEEIPTTVYSHFADGEALMKIVFIQEEEVTVTQLCDKYDVSVSCLQGVDSTNDILTRGDRVIINYGNK